MLPPIFQILKSSNAVKSIVGSSPPRIYRHGFAPQNAPVPKITWFSPSIQPDNNLSDIPDIDRVALQIDCWHQTDAGVVELAQAVRDAIEPHAHMTSTAGDSVDPETKIYRMTLQFDYWLSRGA